MRQVSSRSTPIRSSHAARRELNSRTRVATLTPAKAKAARELATSSSSTPIISITVTAPVRTFSSMRRSIIRNNIFGPQARHNVTFFQDTKNPKLGSSDNKIMHNLFITTGGHGVKFEKSSTRNEFSNNVLIGVRTDGGKLLPNPSALLMEVDGTAGENLYRSNLYSSGMIKGRSAGEQERVSDDYAPGWFKTFSLETNQDPKNFTPADGAPLLGAGALLPDAPLDRDGTARTDPVDLGPIERP